MQSHHGGACLRLLLTLLLPGLAACGSGGSATADAPALAKALPDAPDIARFADFDAPTQPGFIEPAPDGGLFVAAVSHETTHMGDTDSAIVIRLNAMGDEVDRIHIDNDPAARNSVFGLRMRGGDVYATLFGPFAVRKINPQTHAISIYATLPDDLPLCTPAELASNGQDGLYAACAPTSQDLGPTPQGMDFLSDETLLMVDETQAVIYRVPPGGGEATVWYSDARFDGFFGLIDLIEVPGERAVYLSVDFPNVAAFAGVWKLEIDDRGRPAGMAEQLWVARTSDAPYGIDVADNGDIFVAATVGNQIIRLSPQGQELERWPDPVANQGGNFDGNAEVDGLTGIRVVGDRVYVGNQSFATSNRALWAVYGSRLP